MLSKLSRLFLLLLSLLLLLLLKRARLYRQHIGRCHVHHKVRHHCREMAKLRCAGNKARRCRGAVPLRAEPATFRAAVSRCCLDDNKNDLLTLFSAEQGEKEAATERNGDQKMKQNETNKPTREQNGRRPQFIAVGGEIMDAPAVRV